MRACVAGDTGLLGQSLVKFLSVDHEVLGFSRAPGKPERLSKVPYEHFSCDLMDDKGNWQARLADFKPDLLVNAVALADVNACELDPQRAQDLNVGVAERLARCAASQGSYFIHISTDQVFDGERSKPYSETDGVAPGSVYARTKLAAEKAVLSLRPSALVVRTNIIGFRGTGTPTFGEWLCRSLREKTPITLADDFVTSPIHVDDLSRLLGAAFEKKLGGLYHMGSEDAVSKYEFGGLVATALGLDLSTVKRGKLAELRLKPARPPHLALDVSKAKKALGARLPSSRQAAQKLAQDQTKTVRQEERHAGRA